MEYKTRDIRAIFMGKLMDKNFSIDGNIEVPNITFIANEAIFFNKNIKLNEQDVTDDFITSNIVDRLKKVSIVLMKGNCNAFINYNNRLIEYLYKDNELSLVVHLHNNYDVANYEKDHLIYNQLIDIMIDNLSTSRIKVTSTKIIFKCQSLYATPYLFNDIENF